MILKKCSIILLVILLSCTNNEEKDIRFFEISKFDNIIINHIKPLEFIDSMLSIYPKSEYFHGLKIMFIANKGLKDSAINYHNKVAKKFPYINGTFMTMGFAQAIMVHQFSNNWQDSDIDFLESISMDKAKVNIWARIGVFLVNNNAGDFEKAEKYLLEAHEINDKNSYVLHELTKFYIERRNYIRAQFFFKQIDHLYLPKEMKVLKSKLNSLMKNPPKQVQ